MMSESVYVEALASKRAVPGKVSISRSPTMRYGTLPSRVAVSYKDLADASGVEWSKVRYSINQHLGSLVEYAHRKDWPMLSAIVVNKPNVASGSMEPDFSRAL